MTTIIKKKEQMIILFTRQKYLKMMFFKGKNQITYWICFRNDSMCCSYILPLLLLIFLNKTFYWNDWSYKRPKGRNGKNNEKKRLIEHQGQQEREINYNVQRTQRNGRHCRRVFWSVSSSLRTNGIPPWRSPWLPMERLEMS